MSSIDSADQQHPPNDGSGGGGDNVDADDNSTYQPPPQKTIGELVAIDQEDESLRKYKEALLGAAQTETIVVGEYIFV